VNITSVSSTNVFYMTTTVGSTWQTTTHVASLRNELFAYYVRDVGMWLPDDRGSVYEPRFIIERRDKDTKEVKEIAILSTLADAKGVADSYNMLVYGKTFSSYIKEYGAHPSISSAAGLIYYDDVIL